MESAAGERNAKPDLLLEIIWWNGVNQVPHYHESEKS
jgi:hypothetical protein